MFKGIRPRSFLGTAIRSHLTPADLDDRALETRALEPKLVLPLGGDDPRYPIATFIMMAAVMRHLAARMIPNEEGKG